MTERWSIFPKLTIQSYLFICLQMRNITIYIFILATICSIDFNCNAITWQPVKHPAKTSDVMGDTINKIISKASDLSSLPSDSIEGDYNGDGKMELMWLETPILNENQSECKGECTSYIRFSNPAIPSIEIKNCVGGTLKNEGDLNRKRGDEVGILPGLFTSCWSDYHVWTLIKGVWVAAVDPFPTHCNQWEDGVVPIQIDSLKKGFVIINYSINDGIEIQTVSKSVPITR